jgi:hypothetical protein
MLRFYGLFQSIPMRLLAQQFMEETKEQERGRPFSNKEAPVAFTADKQDGGTNNGTKGRPVPDFFRHLVGDTKVLRLCILNIVGDVCCLCHIYSLSAFRLHAV